MKHVTNRCLVALTAVALACAPADNEIDRTEGAEGLRGLELQEPYELQDFTLLDTNGEPFDFRAETGGSLSLLFFGYTNCPDICPVQMAILDEALTDLAYSERRQIQVVFVTTDPERDTSERLRAWLDGFDPSFVGLTGDLERVNEIQGSLNLPPSVIEAPSAAGSSYTVGHGTPILAITGDGLVRALYPSGVRETDWKHDLPLLLGLNADSGTASASPAPAPERPQGP